MQDQFILFNNEGEPVSELCYPEEAGQPRREAEGGSTLGDDNHDYKAISTKITKQADAMLDAICKKNHTTKYDLLQTIIDSCIRYMDDAHRLDPDLQRVMQIFYDGLTASTFRISDYATHPGIIEAIFFLGDPHFKGTRSVLVTEPFFGNATEDWNTTHQLERFLCLTMPKLYRKMRAVSVQMSCNSIQECITRLADEELNCESQDEREIREMFTDNERSDFGRVAPDDPYVRHLNYFDPDART